MIKSDIVAVDDMISEPVSHTDRIPGTPRDREALYMTIYLQNCIHISICAADLTRLIYTSVGGFNLFCKLIDKNHKFPFS